MEAVGTAAMVDMAAEAMVATVGVDTEDMVDAAAMVVGVEDMAVAVVTAAAEAMAAAGAMVAAEVTVAAAATVAAEATVAVADIDLRLIVVAGRGLQEEYRYS